MNAFDPLLMEFGQESATTRRLLELVPTEKLGWRPHAKARSLGELANHIASVQKTIPAAIQTSTYDLSKGADNSMPDNAAAILKAFDANVAESRRVLTSMTDADLLSVWSGQVGGRTVFSAPKVGVLRGILLNHTYHHRGQLSTYLRQLDVALPSVYGPTADENPFA
ncbi:MAG: DinB family protein [Acidobacteriota bacterium]